MQPPVRASRAAWSELEDGVTWATAGTPGRGQIRLMAEYLPDGTWEWTTWRAIRPGEFQAGCVLTQDAACAAAESAASTMTTISHLPPLGAAPDAPRPPGPRGA